MFTGIPYTLFSNNKYTAYLGMAICVILGIGCMIFGMFSENTSYKKLKQEPLLFDYEYIKELRQEYASKKGKYIAVAIPCTTLFILGILSLGLTVSRWEEYHAFIFLGFGIGLFGVAYSSNVMEVYELLVKNEEYSAGLLFKLKRKMKDKIEKM